MSMRTKRVVAIANVVALLLVSVALTSPGGRVSAAGDAAGSSASAIAASGSYADYRAANEAADSPDADIEVNLQTGSADEALKTSMTQTEEGEALQLSGEAGAVTFTFNVPEEGNYALYVEYQPLDTVGDIGLSLRLDGALPFQEAGSLSLERPYQLDGSEFETDEYGNQLSIDKSVAQEWFSRYLTDTSGSYGEPYRFFLTAGTHSVTLDFSKAGLLLRKLSFCQTEEPNPYQAPDSSLNSSGQFQSIQAELPYRTSDSTLTADTDRTDAATYPNEPGVSLLNTIGGSSWTQQGQWISWKFNITEPGVYYIALRARQNIRSGLFSTRKVYIDGEVPFEELNEVKFPNRLGWYNKVLGDDIPYGFYFDAGEHEIRIEVTPGIYADAMQALSEATAILNDYYRRIIMITGTDPDTYQDYALEENIPTMLEDFAALRDILLDLLDLGVR